MTKPRASGKRYGTAAADQSRTAAAVAAVPLSPPSSLTAAEAELFARIVASKPASYWRESDSHLIEQYARLWTQYLDLSAKVAKAKPVTIDGRTNPLFAAQSSIFRQADALLRRLGVTAFQRIEARGGGDGREAKREDERARAAEKARGDLLAGPMH